MRILGIDQKSNNWLGIVEGDGHVTLWSTTARYELRPVSSSRSIVGVVGIEE